MFPTSTWLFDLVSMQHHFRFPGENLLNFNSCLPVKIGAWLQKGTDCLKHPFFSGQNLLVSGKVILVITTGDHADLKVQDTFVTSKILHLFD